MSVANYARTFMVNDIKKIDIAKKINRKALYRSIDMVGYASNSPNIGSHTLEIFQ